MPQVALLVETALGSGRQILKGISRYVHERDNWSVFHCMGSMGAMIPEVIENWEGDGIIARINSPEVLQAVRNKGVPVVDVLGNYPCDEIPIVTCDNEAIAGIVLEHLEVRGFRSFAFLGLEGDAWSLEREHAFEAKVKERGASFSKTRISHELKLKLNWKGYLETLSNWIDSLEKPAGLFICSDQIAPDVVAACDLKGVGIPSDVALIGVDNDPAFCEVIRPSLSSIRPNHQQVGYSAAQMLSAMMEEGFVPQAGTVERIAPYSVETRQSSDVFALDDEGLKRALIAIREHAIDGIRVDEIAAKSGYSRSVLQRRFKQVLGYTVHDLIVKIRVNRAKELLTMTELPIVEVAHRAGFNHLEYLGYVFKRSTGISPARYRKTFSRI